MSPAHAAAVEEVFALVAYETPQESPMGHLMSADQREVPIRAHCLLPDSQNHVIRVDVLSVENCLSCTIMCTPKVARLGATFWGGARTSGG